MTGAVAVLLAILTHVESSAGARGENEALAHASVPAALKNAATCKIDEPPYEGECCEVHCEKQ